MAKGYPQVIKADGLAAGKGVIIAKTPAEAAAAIYQIMEKRIFGDAGNSILIEECLTGPEVSFLAITDGTALQLLPLAQDHKRVGEGDTGPNTGGMGAYAPARFLTEETKTRVIEDVLKPILAALRAEGLDYQGVLYAGLMLTPTGPQMLEINVRLGDPETQAVLPLLETPLIDIADAVAQRELAACPLTFNALSAVTVVLAAPGYPDDPQLGGTITGPGFTKPVADKNRTVFHAGTKLQKDGAIVTSGGRVAAVTAWGKDFETARKNAYAGIEDIAFPGMHYRRDIGAKAGIAA